MPNASSLPEPLLKVRGLTAGYDAGPVLFGIDLDIAPGELIALVGANGAGKSTLLGVLSGLVRATSGTIALAGQDVTNARPEVLVRNGVAHVPQGRRLFGTMSVERNLILGAYLRRDRHVRDDVVRVLGYFPALKDKLSRDAGTLSGGEQQMVAIGRALMGRPELLLLDEPSGGLAPAFVEEIAGIVAALKARGVTMMLVEQNIRLALAVADRFLILRDGRVSQRHDLRAGNVSEADIVRSIYL